MILKRYKYRLYPTKDQIEKIDDTINICRLVYNLALETKIFARKSAQIHLGAYELCKQLPELKEAYPWMKEVDSQALRASIIKLDTSFRNFHKYGKGYPRFKSKSDFKQSFASLSGRNSIDWKNSFLTIPKIYNIPIILSRKFEGKVKTVTIIKTRTNKYFATLTIEIDKDLVSKSKNISLNNVIGIDLGLKSFAVISNGQKGQNPKYLKQSLGRLKTLHKRASRKVKGSNNRKKANLKIALLYEHITNQRNDMLNKISTRLIYDSQIDMICVETLLIKNLSKNHKLAKAIDDSGWGEFIRQLQYKADWCGKHLIKINTFEPTTKRCSNCKELNQSLTLANREWTCESCGITHDRDFNSSKNIRLAGIIQWIKNKTGKDFPSESVE